MMRNRLGWLLAAVVVSWACNDRNDLEKNRRLQKEAELAHEHAEDIARQAMTEAKEAQEQVDQLNRDFTEFNAKLAQAESRLNEAQNDADRAAARAQLDKLRMERAELERRIAATKAAAAKAERAKGVHLSKECLENPLAKGCS